MSLLQSQVLPSLAGCVLFSCVQRLMVPVSYALPGDGWCSPFFQLPCTFVRHHAFWAEGVVQTVQGRRRLSCINCSDPSFHLSVLLSSPTLSPLFPFVILAQELSRGRSRFHPGSEPGHRTVFGTCSSSAWRPCPLDTKM